MNDQILEYEQFFTSEQFIRIAFVAETRKLPEISGAVSYLHGDLIEVELEENWPKDVTPASAGYLLELRSAVKGSAFRCRALLISDTKGHIISMRLVGNVIIEELREYFRIDTYLPLRYIPMPDRDDKTVLRRWLELVESRTKRINNPTGFIFRGKPSTKASQSTPNAIPLEYTTPVVANISGGGLRTNLPEQLQPGCKAILELYLPDTPPKIIDIIGEVLSSSYLYSDDDGRTFSTPFKFTHLGEQDRDTLIKYIQKAQLRQIREISEDMSSPDLPEQNPPNLYKGSRNSFKYMLIAVASLFIAMVLFDMYKHRGKSEVGLIFEKGIRMYMDKQSSGNP